MKKLIIILLIALALRLLVAQQPFQEDEYHWASSATRHDWFGTVMRNSPLSIYAMNTATSILGTSTLAIRLVFILTGLATIFCVYQYTRKKHGEHTAVISALLLAISPHHILASTQATYEGSFFTLFFFLTITAALEQRVTLTSIAFGLALLSKTSALIIIPPLILLLQLSQEPFKQAIKKTSTIVLAGIALFFFFFGIPSIIIHSPALINSIYQLASQANFSTTNHTLRLFQYAHALLWIGPLFFFLTLQTKNKKIWTIIIYTLIFYTLIVRDNFPPIERYLMIILPFLAILTAQTITTITWKPNRAIACTLVSSTLLIVGILLQTHPTYVQFHPKEATLHSLTNGHWNTLIPLTGSSGPLGFYLTFSSLALPLLFSGIITFIAQVSKKKYKTTHTILLLALGLSYNTLFLIEYTTGTFHGSIPQATQNIINYANTHNLPRPIYILRNYALQHHLNENYKQNPAITTTHNFNYFSLKNYLAYNPQEELHHATQQPLDKNIITHSFSEAEQLKTLPKGSYLITDFPHINKQGNFWTQLTTTCNHTKLHTYGHIFTCT